MLWTFKHRICPTKAQETLLMETLSTCCKAFVVGENSLSRSWIGAIKAVVHSGLAGVVKFSGKDRR